jgi:uncharacterized protein YndB with AHSA1/START domain
MQDDERDFEITKRVDASIDDVFSAFTEADRLEGWWGPEGFNVTDVTSDPRLGGELRLVMTGPDGSSQPVEGTYREVSPSSRVIAEISAVAAGSPLLTAVLTIDLKQADGGTEIRLSVDGKAFAPQGRGMLAGMQEGWTSSLICLERFLEESQGPSLKARHETA